MINIQTIADFISNKLAEMKSRHTFKIFAETGAGVEDLISSVSEIQGVLHKSESNNPPLKGFITSTSKCKLEFLIPCPNGVNKYLLQAIEVVDKAFSELNGETYKLCGGDVLFTANDSCLVGDIKATHIGHSCVLTISFTIQYSVALTTYNDYEASIKMPGIIDEYTGLPLLSLDNHKMYAPFALQDIANVSSGIDVNQNFARTFNVSFYATNNEAINALIDNYLNTTDEDDEQTNNEIWLKIKRHDTIREYRVKVADIQSNTPNGLGYETITVLFTKQCIEKQNQAEDNGNVITGTDGTAN